MCLNLMRKPGKAFRLLLGFALLLLVFSLMNLKTKASIACSVPVFQYALQTWPADRYELVILYKDKLTERQKKIVSWMKSCAEKPPHANLRVTEREISTLTEKEKEALSKEIGKYPLPYMLLRYPLFLQIPGFAWHGPLNRENAERLIDSPARKELAKRLVGGQTAVWVFLPSGNASKDKAAKENLEKILQKASKLLELPPPPPDPFAEDYSEQEIGENLQDNEKGVQNPKSEEKGAAEQEEESEARHPVFSILEVDRNDSREKLFVSMLLGTEPDLRSLKEPITFPVFGRGRSLFAYAGEGINEDNIAEACLFLTGPCSCQVKGMNPGVDILMAFDWESALDSLYSGKPVQSLQVTELPTLDLPEEMVGEKLADQKELEVVKEESSPAEGEGSILPYVIVGCGLFFLLGTTLGTLFVLRKKNSGP